MEACLGAFEVEGAALMQKPGARALPEITLSMFVLQHELGVGSQPSPVFFQCLHPLLTEVSTLLFVAISQSYAGARISSAV